MRDLKTAAVMVGLARKHLAALGGMLSRDAFAEEIYGFHAQQAVEKALKGLLSIVAGQVPKTHDLELLFTLLDEAGVELPREMLELVHLTDFAVIFEDGEIELCRDIDRSAVMGRVAWLVDCSENALRKSKRS